MSETPFPDWLPDWRDSSQYLDPESTSRKQWAWEFLRRNRMYQAEWKKKDAADYAVRYSPEEYETYHKWACMVSLGGKWGLACNAPDPSIDVPEVLLFQEAYSVGAMTYEHVEQFGAVPYTPGDWRFVNVVFNLELPLHPQLKDAKHYLTETKARFISKGKIKRPDKLHRLPSNDLLLSYLRCFDARAKGATYSEVAEVLFPLLNDDFPDLLGTQRVKDHVAAANVLIDSKYRYLTSKAK